MRPSRHSQGIASLGSPAAWIVALLGIAAFIAFVSTRSYQPTTFDLDLLAFDCGGAATAAGHDPYRVEPLRSCEHALGSGFRPGSPLVIPDPLPPYDQVLFAAFSRLPYRALQTAWGAIELAAVVGTAVLLARTCALPFVVVASALAVSDLYCSMILGQVVPVCVFGIALVGSSLERRNCVLSTFGLLLAMTEPHLGIAALCGVLVAGGRLRPSAAIATGILASVSVAIVPSGTIVEYFTRVIPAHALSEIDNQDQLSLAYELHLAGVGAAAAEIFAKLEYGIMLLAGVKYANAARRTFGAPAAAFAPVAFVLVGGPFLHVTQMAAALPIALLVAGRAKSRMAAVAASLIAIPWLEFSTVLTVLPLAGISLAILLRRLVGLSGRGTAAGVALALSALTVAAFWVAAEMRPFALAYGHVSVSELAETSWATLVSAGRHGHVWLSNAAKIPSFAALATIVWIIVRRSTAADVTGGRATVSSPARPISDLPRG